jgi:hypothetical protein
MQADAKMAFGCRTWGEVRHAERSTIVTYAKKSSTTVLSVLYIMAFIGICATLLRRQLIISWGTSCKRRYVRGLPRYKR